MPSQLMKELYLTVRRSPIAHCVSPSVPACWDTAVTLRKWDALEQAGFVRLRCEEDPDFDPRDFDNPEDYAGMTAYGSIGEYTLDPDAVCRDWEHGDSCWGHTGYRDCMDWRENPYITGIMAETIDAFRNAWKQHARGECPHCHGTGRKIGA